MLDQSAITYSPSVTLWREQPASSGSRPVLAIGYNSHNLQHAEREAQLVARLTNGLCLAGPQAKGDWLKEQAGHWPRLHFACHGQFNHQSPLDSWLEIGAGERIPAGEVMAGWQLSADLVVLSACQSGVSQILRGDEPMGLVRALLQVGAQAVLVTQWPVADLPTFLLMGRFYHLLNELAPAGALRAAQQWLRALSEQEARQFLSEENLALPAERLDSGRPFAHPRHWAAFLLIS